MYLFYDFEHFYIFGIFVFSLTVDMTATSGDAITLVIVDKENILKLAGNSLFYHFNTK